MYLKYQGSPALKPFLHLGFQNGHKDESYSFKYVLTKISNVETNLLDLLDKKDFNQYYYFHDSIEFSFYWNVLFRKTYTMQFD